MTLHININQTYLPKLGAVSSLPEYSRSLSPTMDLICLTRSKSPVASTRKFMIAKNNSHCQRSIKIKMHLITSQRRRANILPFNPIMYGCSASIAVLSRDKSTLVRPGMSFVVEERRTCYIRIITVKWHDFVQAHNFKKRRTYCTWQLVALDLPCQ